MSKKLLLFFVLFIHLSCTRESESGSLAVAKKEHKYQLLNINVIEESREEILSQTEDWVSKYLGYFNVVEQGNEIKLWYTGWGKANYSEFGNNFCYASAIDENSPFLKSKPNNIINGPELSHGVLENFVFFDSKMNQFRMIGVERNSQGVASTYMWSSTDGLSWTNKVKVFDLHHDSQFSVIVKDGYYDVFLRLWSEGRRSVGYARIKPEGEVIVKPTLVRAFNYDEYYKHVYNSAVSFVQGRNISFPTLYNSDKDEMIISYGEILQYDLILSNKNLTKSLFGDLDIKWAIVSPNIIPTNVPSEYWLYYYGSLQPHFQRQTRPGYTKYFRIKISISQQENV